MGRICSTNERNVHSISLRKSEEERQLGTLGITILKWRGREKCTQNFRTKI